MKTDTTSLIKFIEDKYDVGRVNSLKKIDSGVTNKNFIVSTPSGKYVLRLTTKSLSNQILNMIPFMEYAKKQKFPCPEVIYSKNKVAYFVEGKQLLLLMSFEPGKQLTLETITDNRISSFASALAKLHAFKWDPPHKARELELNHSFVIYDKYLSRVVNSEFSGKEEFLNNMSSENSILRDSLPDIFSKLPKGIVHNDPTPWNALYIGDNLSSLVDLEGIGKGVLLVDIARAINIWCFEKDGLNKDYLNKFLSAYSAQRPLTQYEKQCLPIILRFVAFRHSSYFMKMYIEHRHDNPSDSIDYECLRYYQKIGNEQLLNELFG